MHRDITEDVVDGPLTFRPFSETVFIEDLATAYAVVASAGFTLMGECVYLRKPLLAVPLRGQFEQAFNARFLAHEGYGSTADEVDGASLSAFLEKVPSFQKHLAGYHQEGNVDLLSAVDQHLDRAAAGVY